MATTYDDPAFVRLTGSSTPTGAPPSFAPLQPPDASRSDPVFDLIDEHRAALNAWVASAPKGEDLPSGPLADTVTETLNAVAAAEPTTVPGLRAWLEYMDELVEEHGEWHSIQEAMPGIADAARRLLWSSTPSNNTRPDDRLVGLAAEFDDILMPLSEAGRERARLLNLHDENLPPIPVGLLVDPQNRFSEDVEHFAHYVPGDYGGSRYYTAQAIHRLRTIPRIKYLREPHPSLQPGDVVLRKVPDEQQQARVPAVLAAFDEWDAACKRHSEEIGYDAAKANFERLTARYKELLTLITATDAVGLQGLAAQASVLQTTYDACLIYAVTDKIADWAKYEAAGARAGRFVSYPQIGGDT